MSNAMTNRYASFTGGDQGEWRVLRQKAIAGEPVPSIKRLKVSPEKPDPSASTWVLEGITSNERYVERKERTLLLAHQQALGQAAATCAVLIPIRKNAAWWSMTQDERRAVFEARSRHIEIGLRYASAIARRLYHCRDLSEHQPFDFLTWFEFAPGDEAAFDQLLVELRASEEWQYVERESELRLIRE